MIRAGEFMRGAKVWHSPRLSGNPRVSIVLPTYCRGDNGLLERSIGSVLGQSFADFELIVMDDGSTDATADVIESFVRSDDRVIHVRHDVNCGLPALRVNEGLLMARADICAYQFDDDRWTNSFLENMTGALGRNPDFGVAYGLCQLSVPGDEETLGGPFDYSRLMTANYIANNSVVHRRSVFERLGGYDMHLVIRRLCDWDLWLRWGKETPFLFVEEAVTMVEARRPESIGKTCAPDGIAMRAHIAMERNARLRPESLGDYVVDDLWHLRHLGKRKLESVWRQQIVSYLARSQPLAMGVRPPEARPLHVLVCKDRHTGELGTRIANFAESLKEDFAFTIVVEAQTDEAAMRCADILMLYGMAGERAEQLAATARGLGKTVIFAREGERTGLAGGLEILPNIQRKWLARARARVEGGGDGEAASPVKIGLVGKGASDGEMAAVWPAVVEASRVMGAGAMFYFWGEGHGALEELGSPYCSEPGAATYEQYLERLTSTGLDVMVAPRGTDGGMNFLETTAAGAAGVSGDGGGGIEPGDSQGGFDAAARAPAFGAGNYRAYRTGRHQRSAGGAGGRRSWSRGVLRQRLRGADTRPRIAYFCHSPYLSSAGNRLLGYAGLAQEFHCEPVLVLPADTGATGEAMQRSAAKMGIETAYLPLIVETEMDTGRELNEGSVQKIRRWLEENGIGMAHSFHLMREVGEAAAQCGIPHVASLYESYARGCAGVRHCDLVHSDAEVYADAWSEVLDRPARRVMAYVQERYFDLEYPAAQERLTVGVFGSVQPHNGQLEAVEAIGMLKRNGAEVALWLFGYEHFNPAYVAECKGLVEKYGLAGLVTFCGFAEDRAEAMRELDAVLCASDRGAIPEELPEAMAAGRLAMAPACGGMAELISRKTGIPMADRSAASIAQAVHSARTMTGAERREKTERARGTANVGCSKYAVARELFRLYREAIDEHGPVREAVGEVNGKYRPVRQLRFARLLQSARGAWGVK